MTFEGFARKERKRKGGGKAVVCCLCVCIVSSRWSEIVRFAVWVDWLSFSSLVLLPFYVKVLPAQLTYSKPLYVV